MPEMKMRYLEMIQNIISRMANNSFLLKGWSVTVISGIFSINLEKISSSIYILIYFVIILFWILDSFYLQLERRYRRLYKECLKSNEINFSLEPVPAKYEDKTTYSQVFFSITEIGFYLLLAIIISIVFWLL